MTEEKVCDWCGEETESNLIGVDYDDETGVYGSMICEKCYQTRPRKPGAQVGKLTVSPERVK